MTPPETVTYGPDNPAVAPTSILVIDDDSAVCDVLNEMLKAYGYIVETAQSGRAAVACLRHRHFDVALADLAMPDTDGIQTMAALKDLDADLEVIIITGYAGVDSASAALKQGACDYLQKPITGEQLHNAVARAIEIRRLNSSLSPDEAARALVKSTNRRDLTISQFVKRKRAEEELRLTQFSVENASDGVFWTDAGGRILYANAAACRSLGRSHDELVSLTMPDIDPRFSKSAWEAFWKELKERGSMIVDTEQRTKQGRVFPVEVSAKYIEFGGKEYCFAFTRDITERQRAERRQQLSTEILSILNEPLDVADAVNRILLAIKQATGVDAAGIRLRSGDDFPYFVQSGFSPEFLLTQNTLMARDENGCPLWDKQGNISLECGCGLVISGQTDPANSLFTEGGSFWINNSLRLLDIPANQDPRLHPRNKCVHLGYASVALIPIRSRHQVVGLLQLNAREKNRFTLDTIQFFEGISASIGVALIRKQQEDVLRRSEARLKEALAAAQMGIWEWVQATNTVTWDERLYRIMCRDPNLPAPSFEEQQQIYAPPGRQRLQAAVQNAIATGTPYELDLELVRPDGATKWLIARGEPRRDASGRFTGLGGSVQDITERERAQIALQASEARHRRFVERNSATFIRSTMDGTILDCNEAAVRLLGYDSVADLKSCRMGDFYFAREQRDIMLALLKKEKVLTGYEFQLKRKDGTRAWFLANMALVEDEAREVIESTAVDLSERKRAEETLRASEQQFRELAETIREVFFVSTPEPGRVMYVSPAYEQVWGRPREEIYARPDAWIESIYAEDRPRAIQFFVQSQQGSATDHEYRIVRPDGAIRWVRNRTFPVYDGAGKFSRVVGIAEDITDRRQAEQALVQTEEKYRSLVLNLPDVVWTADAEGHYAFMSPNIEKMSGYTISEIEHHGARLFLEAIHPDDVSTVRNSLQALFERGQAYDVECRVRRKSGEWIWVHDRSHTTYVKNGVRYSDGLLSDITARKRAEEELLFKTALLEGQSQTTLDAILVVDDEGKIGFANKRFGLDFEIPDELLSTRDDHIVRALVMEKVEDPKSFMERIDYLASHRDEKSRDELKLKNGKVFDRYSTSLLDSNGKYRGRVWYFRDITVRKQAEEEMRKAKEAAEAANQAKSQFLANMSHEIRTPMNGVIGMAGLLLDTELTAEQQHYASIVRASGEALLTVINDILDFSKIEARKLLLEVTDFDLQTVLENAIAVLALKASEKRLELTCEMESGTPWLLQGDPGRLRQVLVNLLGNAVKFTPAGEVAMRVRLEAAEGRLATLRFTVQDTGIGFRQDRAAALFAPFVQGDGSRTRRYGGTGLGLAISKQLVEMMGGQIGVKSEENKGSTFWFTGVFARQPQGEMPVADLPSSLQDAKVLVVDDNPTNRSLVCRLLASWGCRPQEAGDGDSALMILRQAAQASDPFRVALLDFSLPGMDGQELGRRIAGDPKLKQTALILMTGFGQRHEDDDHLYGLGFAGHLSKPIWERTLREVLLPLSEKYSAAPAPAEVTPRRGTDAREDKLTRILVVEDNVTNQDVAVAILKKLGYRANLVANGQEALAVLREADYDVVLMDCEMPEMDGYEATSRIRRPETGMRNPQIPIIALTADAISGDRERCLAAGMNDYLAKPIRAEQLAVALEKWLNCPAGNAECPAAGQTPATRERVFNSEELLNRLMGDEVLARELLTGFLNDVPKQLTILKERLAAGDAAGVKLQAHTLKGAAATVAAVALRDVCFEAQQAVGAGELGRVRVLLPRLEEQFELLKTTLKHSGWA